MDVDEGVCAVYIWGYIANLVTNISTVHMHGLTVIHEGAKQQVKRLTEWPGTSTKSIFRTSA